MGEEGGDGEVCSNDFSPRDSAEKPNHEEMTIAIVSLKTPGFILSQGVRWYK
ncbi:hypothetical protein [Laspinema olomoucense]|uniref:hypothetical protein n=1 Tax=Laspinema olomoucense TaxID=3231600 RepID=UPI0021BB1D80|nr:hypothetical protein [Laspinema sp. D3c]MCT7996288.1 hypothetical protein [Laspinema sp. D3c]